MNNAGLYCPQRLAWTARRLWCAIGAGDGAKKDAEGCVDKARRLECSLIDAELT